MVVHCTARVFYVTRAVLESGYNRVRASSFTGETAYLTWGGSAGHKRGSTAHQGRWTSHNSGNLARAWIKYQPIKAVETLQEQIRVQG